MKQDSRGDSARLTKQEISPQQYLTSSSPLTKKSKKDGSSKKSKKNYESATSLKVNNFLTAYPSQSLKETSDITKMAKQVSSPFGTIYKGLQSQKTIKQVEPSHKRKDSNLADYIKKRGDTILDSDKNLKQLGEKYRAKKESTSLNSSLSSNALTGALSKTRSAVFNNLISQAKTPKSRGKRSEGSGNSLGEKKTLENSNNEPSLENIQEEMADLCIDQNLDMSSDDEQLPAKVEVKHPKKINPLLKSYQIPERRPLLRKQMVTGSSLDFKKHTERTKQVTSRYLESSK